MKIVEGVYSNQQSQAIPKLSRNVDEQTTTIKFSNIVQN